MRISALLLSLVMLSAGGPVWAEEPLVTGPDRRHEIDLRLEELAAERAGISVEGPKVATFVGIGTIVLGAILVGVGVKNCNEHKRDTGESTCSGPDSGFAATAAGGGLMAVGAGTALAGGAIWAERTNRRSEIDAERASLIEERDRPASPLSRIQLRNTYRDDTHFVTLGLRF